MSLKPGTIVKIYKGTSHFEDGAVSRVLDYDPMQKEYLVGENIGEDDHWVKEAELEEIKFEKESILHSKNFAKGIWVGAFCYFLGTLLRDLVNGSLV